MKKNIFLFFNDFLIKKRELIIQFFKFGLVGTLGMIIDLGLLNLLFRVFDLNLYLSATVSFITAVTNNYLLNRNWTFKNIINIGKRLHTQYAQFAVVSIIGLSINLSIMFVLVEKFDIWYNWAKIAAIFVVFSWNFSINKLWTFKEKTS